MCYKTLEESILEVNEMRRKSMNAKEEKLQRNSGDLYLKKEHFCIIFCFIYQFYVLQLMHNKSQFCNKLMNPYPLIMKVSYIYLFKNCFKTVC